jgi:HPt (histidine-containing phosphotransfer) domain-containing protein
MARPSQEPQQRRHKCQTLNPQILDVVHLRRYTQGNRELEAELLDLFGTQLPALIAEIGHGTNAGDWKLAVHTLKGSARSVGAAAIGDLAQKLEEAGFSAPPKTRTRLVRRLKQAVEDFAHEARKLASGA